jgi:D-alanine-D-alanine ligase
MSDKIRVAVVFGGQSGEHEVSIVSAHAVMQTLDPDKYDVVPVGITREGRWLIGSSETPQGAWEYLVAQSDRRKLPSDMARKLEAREQALLEESSDFDQTEELVSPQHLVASRKESAVMTSPQALLRDIDVVFPVLHGPKGEDGTIQGMLELADVPYVGCGVMASAVCMDKAMMKAAFAAAELPLLPWILVRRSDWERQPEAVYDAVEAKLSYPMFVKPANMGSSVGISKVTDRASLAEGLLEAARYDRRIVIEQGISAREIEISVLGNENPETSVAGEIVPSGDWYDYDAKYIDGASRELIPAPLDEQQAALVREMALRAFESADCSGLARVDFLLDKETGEFWINEVNTMPGFTSISMYAKLWAASGLSYSDLVDKLISLAIERKS